MASNVARSAGRDPIRQFAIFAENKVGKLNELVGALASHNIHPLALSTQDTTDSAIVRLVVDDPAGAERLLLDHGYTFSRSDLLGVEMDAASDLRYVLAALMEAEINIHYVYPFVTRPNGKCGLVMHVDDYDISVHVLQNRQLRVLRQGDVSR
ncbi:MAG: acetolactate synthase [Verrucomicrobiae bacterium]|nr:acetolactate synthase [Verrucomicrobiae bacterium]